MTGVSCEIWSCSICNVHFPAPTFDCNPALLTCCHTAEEHSPHAESTCKISAWVSVQTGAVQPEGQVQACTADLVEHQKGLLTLAEGILTQCPLGSTRSRHALAATVLAGGKALAAQMLLRAHSNALNRQQRRELELGRAALTFAPLCRCWAGGS